LDIAALPEQNTWRQEVLRRYVDEIAPADGLVLVMAGPLMGKNLEPFLRLFFPPPHIPCRRANDFFLMSDDEAEFFIELYVL
jgi:hypothetical protein